jgi:CrcB protein
MNLVYVFIGGGIGSVIRYAFSLWIKRNPESMSLPYATLLANVLAAILFALSVKSLMAVENSSWRWFILTGVCGGLSTFSTFSFETFELLKNGNWQWAIANVLLSLALCLIPFYLFTKA